MLAGIDEVGRGCIAGPVIAAAVILPAEGAWLAGLADSKKLSSRRRAHLADAIRTHSLAWSIGRAEVVEIDRLNILNAALLAMRRACLGLGVAPAFVQVDGNRLPNLPFPCEAVVGGDARIAAISAASIIAKVYRDREMDVLDTLFPGYGLSVHKGYPTAEHLTRLAAIGPSSLHRRSFRPVAEVVRAFG